MSKLLDRTSLAATVDAVNDAIFWGRDTPQRERVEAAEWIARLPAAYEYAMPGPTAKDYSGGLRFFTGERIDSIAGVAHCLGEEACRALILLDVRRPSVEKALRRAGDWLAAGEQRRRGHYCCDRCTAALWRHLAARSPTDAEAEKWLAAGLRRLRGLRTDDGRWGSFPFHYTLLALTNVDLPGALREMRHAAPVCERLVRRSPREDIYDQRRHALAERVLARC